jgi:hypothetical protein
MNCAIKMVAVSKANKVFFTIEVSFAAA